MLTLIKLLHTLVWAAFVCCILLIWIYACQGNFAGAAICIGVVMLEVLLLMATRRRCPLTLLAARYTTERQANFDIYLPLWLAQHNQLVFGLIYAAAVVFALLKWSFSTP